MSKLGDPSPQPSPRRGEGVGWSAGGFGVPRPFGERDAGRQGEGTALAKTAIARRLRRDATEAENRVWTHLRNRQLAGWKFVRQLPVAGFYADFACREAMLIVEVDGSQHAESEFDTTRTARLKAEGYRVLRFWNNDVLQDTDSVLLAILEGLAQRRKEGKHNEHCHQGRHHRHRRSHL